MAKSINSSTVCVPNIERRRELLIKRNSLEQTLQVRHPENRPGKAGRLRKTGEAG
jgi:hypothetical protein